MRTWSRRRRQSRFLVEHVTYVTSKAHSPSQHIQNPKSARKSRRHHHFILMGETSEERIRPPPSGKIPRETRLSLTSPTYAHLQSLNPVSKLSPGNNGSALYDSYELRAVTYQLNKAMQRSSGSSPGYLCYLKTPFYSQCLDRVNRGNSRAPKKVLCSHLTCATINRNARDRMKKEVTKGFAAKLWNKVKQGLGVISRGKS